MTKTIIRTMATLLIVAVMALAGCAGNQQGYQKAFDGKYSLTHNQASFPHSSEAVFKLVKQTFTQQGFTIETADMKSGIIKAVRNMADKNDSEISYNIQVSADVSEVPGVETNVSLAASQQTILHRSTTTWWHLLWILPIIPTGTEYQTLVIAEGNVTDPGFYTDCFNSLKVSVAKYDFAVKKAAAEKAEAERIAAEKAAKAKAEAEAKAAAERAEAERVAAEKAAKLKAEAEAKAAAEKAAAEKAAAEKAAADIAAKLKAEADAKAAAEPAAGAKPEANAKPADGTVVAKDAAAKP